MAQMTRNLTLDGACCEHALLDEREVQKGLKGAERGNGARGVARTPQLVLVLVRGPRLPAVGRYLCSDWLVLVP